MMTTLHRKPRGASEQSASASGATSHYTTIDILPSASSARDASGGVNSGSHQSSKTRRHGGGKYVRRTGFFGSGSPSSSLAASSSTSTAQSKKMSTTQLRAFFAACVLVYLSALYFAEDIVKFGKAVNSDATRQKLFSQWRPVHSAAKQYLRSIVDTANADKDGAAVANATAVVSESETPAITEETHATAVVSDPAMPAATQEMHAESASPEPSTNLEREPPTAPVIATVPEGQVAPVSEELPAALLLQEASTESEADRLVKPLLQVKELTDEHPDDNPAVEIKEEQPQHELVVVENDKFDPAQMEDRMEDSAVVDEPKETLNRAEASKAQQESPSPSTAANPTLPEDSVAETEPLALPESTPAVASPAAPSAAVPVVEQPQTAAAVEKSPAEDVNAATPPPLSHDDAVNDDGEDGETQVSRGPVETQADAEEEAESRHPGRDET